MRSVGRNLDFKRRWIAITLVGLLLYAQFRPGLATTLQPERQAGTDFGLTSDADLQKVAAVKRFWEVVRSIDWVKAKEPVMRSKITEAMAPFDWRFDRLTLQNSAETTIRKRMDASLSVDSPNRCLNAAVIAQALGLPSSVTPPELSALTTTSQPEIENYVRENSKVRRFLFLTYSIADQPRYELHFAGPFDCLGSFSVREPRSEAALKAANPQPKKWNEPYPEPTADANPKKVAAAKRLWEVVQSIDWATKKKPAMRTRIRREMEPFAWEFETLTLASPPVVGVMYSKLSRSARMQCPNAAAVAQGIGLPSSLTFPMFYEEKSRAHIEKFIRNNHKEPEILGMFYPIPGQPQYELYISGGDRDCFYEYSVLFLNRTKHE